MIIEKGKQKDIEELERLYDCLNDYLAATINYPGWIKHIYPVRETAEQGITEESLFVCRIDGRITGSVILNHKPEIAYEQVKWGVDIEYNRILVVRTLVVHPDFLQQGVGKALMEFAEYYAEQLDIRSIRLDVSIDNTPAIALYEKMGYQYRGTVDLGLPYEHLKWFRLYEKITQAVNQ